ncbi:MAG: gamma-glutamyl-gamma-aminobutyrate hydrolase family protein [Idiomarina sp.]|nr:gamma-glutamyl-gamma-aminobutyrate hydrolase family protein [Idiomarina sp.]
MRKKIIISQRYDQVASRSEWRDSLDAEWAVLVESIGACPILVPNKLANIICFLEEVRPDGIILSGGNDIGSAPFRDQTEAKLLEFAKVQTTPVLGVCRGMQYMNHAEGGALSACNDHVGERHRLSGDWAEEHGFTEVNSFHNLAITPDGLAPAFKALAKTRDDVVEAFEHISYPWLGVMWHPEREKPFSQSDIQLIKKHFGL